MHNKCNDAVCSVDEASALSTDHRASAVLRTTSQQHWISTYSVTIAMPSSPLQPRNSSSHQPAHVTTTTETEEETEKSIA